MGDLALPLVVRLGDDCLTLNVLGPQSAKVWQGGLQNLPE